MLYLFAMRILDDFLPNSSWNLFADHSIPRQFFSWNQRFSSMLRERFPTPAEDMTPWLNMSCLLPILAWKVSPVWMAPELLPVPGAVSPWTHVGSQGTWDSAEQKLHSKESWRRQFTNRVWKVSSAFQFRCFVLGLNLLLTYFCFICILSAEG